MNTWNALPDNIIETIAGLKNLAGLTRGSIMYAFETICSFVSRTDIFSVILDFFFFF